MLVLMLSMIVIALVYSAQSGSSCQTLFAPAGTAVMVIQGSVIIMFIFMFYLDLHVFMYGIKFFVALQLVCNDGDDDREKVDDIIQVLK